MYLYILPQHRHPDPGYPFSWKESSSIGNIVEGLIQLGSFWISVAKLTNKSVGSFHLLLM